MTRLVDVLTQHAPHRDPFSESVVKCACGERGFHRDADGNLRKDGEDERAWAEHVAEALRRSIGRPPPLDPHVTSRTESGYEVVGLWGRGAGDYTRGPDHEQPEQTGIPVGAEACPDCKAGKHPVCTGDSWDNALDGPVRCPCAVNGHRS